MRGRDGGPNANPDPGTGPRPSLVFALSTLGVNRGGLETLAVSYARQLASRGYPVALLAGGTPGDPPPPGVSSIRVAALSPPSRLEALLVQRVPALALRIRSRGFLLACRLRPRAWRAISQADATVTFLEEESLRLSLWRRRRGRAHIAFHPGVIDPRRAACDRSTVRIAGSSTVADASAALLRIDGVVPPGVDRRFRDLTRTIRETAETVLFVGRLERNKGVVELLEIFRRLASTRPELRLRLVGDGPLREKITDIAGASGIASRVTLTGALPAARVADEMGRADLLLFPSHFESFGIAALEALATGLPAVVSDLPGLREAVDDAAVLVPPGEPETWAAAASMLLDDVERRRTLSAAGRRRAEAFTWEAAADRLEPFIALALQRATGTRGERR